MCQTVKKLGEDFFRGDQLRIAPESRKRGRAVMVLIARIDESTPEEGVSEDSVHLFFGEPRR